MGKLKITVASWADRDDLVVELAAGEEDVGHLEYDRWSERVVLNLYPRPGGGDWSLDLDEVQEVLDAARARLSEVAAPAIVQ